RHRLGPVQPARGPAQPRDLLRRPRQRIRRGRLGPDRARDRRADPHRRPDDHHPGLGRQRPVPQPAAAVFGPLRRRLHPERALPERHRTAPAPAPDRRQRPPGRRRPADPGHPQVGELVGSGQPPDLRRPAVGTRTGGGGGPPAPTAQLDAPERAVLAEELVNEAALRQWMKARGLALVVVRNQTSRDRADRQQPFNLQVPGGVKTTNGNGRLYSISHFQVFQGNQVRAYDNFRRGRRVLAQPMSVQGNPANPGGPAGSVAIARDGSSAAFVPASQALTWQTTDPDGEAVVRERVWVTMQPGEIRTCTGCHGENTYNQAGAAASRNKPEALRALLRHWKQDDAGGGSVPRRRNGSSPLSPDT